VIDVGTSRALALALLLASIFLSLLGCGARQAADRALNGPCLRACEAALGPRVVALCDQAGRCTCMGEEGTFVRVPGACAPRLLARRS